MMMELKNDAQMDSLAGSERKSVEQLEGPVAQAALKKIDGLSDQLTHVMKKYPLPVMLLAVGAGYLANHLYQKVMTQIESDH
jgi:hypothetical protein